MSNGIQKAYSRMDLEICPGHSKRRRSEGTRSGSEQHARNAVHRNAHGPVAAGNGLGAQAGTLGTHKIAKRSIFCAAIVQRHRIIRQRHRGTRKTSMMQRRQPVMWPHARLTADTRPRHLKHGAHAHTGRATIQRIAARRAHQNAVDIESGSRAENRAHVCVVDNTSSTHTRTGRSPAASTTPPKNSSTGI